MNKSFDPRKFQIVLREYYIGGGHGKSTCYTLDEEDTRKVLELIDSLKSYKEKHKRKPLNLLD